MGKTLNQLNLNAQEKYTLVFFGLWTHNCFTLPQNKLKLLPISSLWSLASLGGMSWVNLTPVLFPLSVVGMCWLSAAGWDTFCFRRNLLPQLPSWCPFQLRGQLGVAIACCNISSGERPGLHQRSLGLRSAPTLCVMTPLGPELLWEEAEWWGELPGGPGGFFWR